MRALGYDDFYNLENSEDDQSSAGGGEEDTTHIGDDICLDDLTGTAIADDIKYVYDNIIEVCRSYTSASACVTLLKLDFRN